MNDILRDLLLNGFMIYPANGKFAVKKESVPSNPQLIGETFYENYDLAIEAAGQMLKTPKSINWTAIVRYNRGLGIEYKNLPDICASNPVEAKEMAQKIAETMIEPDAICELKVRPKF